MFDYFFRYGNKEEEKMKLHKRGQSLFWLLIIVTIGLLIFSAIVNDSFSEKIIQEKIFEEREYQQDNYYFIAKIYWYCEVDSKTYALYSEGETYNCEWERK
ncbi:MAG: hypothetical protein A2W22_05475 [Candidatus Levybacteria bacterium RBG_16_35_11]|nr:MAG: hypothetical protein A2W22_05475 [Candidatus Levybacteria bacterium RBG_16_35_11]